MSQALTQTKIVPVDNTLEAADYSLEHGLLLGCIDLRNG